MSRTGQAKFFSCTVQDCRLFIQDGFCVNLIYPLVPVFIFPMVLAFRKKSEISSGINEYGRDKLVRGMCSLTLESCTPRCLSTKYPSTQRSGALASSSPSTISTWHHSVRISGRSYCCGSGMDPNFFHPGSKFFPSWIHIKEKLF
jgi:hypothetical protein